MRSQFPIERGSNSQEFYSKGNGNSQWHREQGGMKTGDVNTTILNIRRISMEKIGRNYDKLYIQFHSIIFGNQKIWL